MNNLFYIDYEKFDENRLDGFRSYKENLLYPLYKYTDNYRKGLHIKTPFIKLSRFSESQLLRGSILINPENFITNEMNKSIIKFDNYIKNYMDKKYEGKLLFGKRILENTGYYMDTPGKKSDTVDLNGHLSEINLKLNVKRDNATKVNKDNTYIIADIYNYNVSKKYPKMEYFQKIQVSKLTRFLKKEKELRFIVRPYVFINKMNKTYITRLKVIKMEVKYPDVIINSVIDNNEATIKPKYLAVDV